MGKIIVTTNQQEVPTPVCLAGNLKCQIPKRCSGETRCYYGPVKVVEYVSSIERALAQKTAEVEAFKTHSANLAKHLQDSREENARITQEFERVRGRGSFNPDVGKYDPHNW